MSQQTKMLNNVKSLGDIACKTNLGILYYESWEWKSRAKIQSTLKTV